MTRPVTQPVWRGLTPINGVSYQPPACKTSINGSVRLQSVESAVGGDA